MKKQILKSVMLGAVAVGSVGVQAAEANYVPGELIVKVKEGKVRSFFNDINTLSTFAINREIQSSTGNFFVVKIDESRGVQNTINALMANDDIEYAEPNFIYTTIRDRDFLSELAVEEDSEVATAPTNDPMIGKLWGLNNTGKNDPSGKTGVKGVDVNAYAAWDKYKSGDKAVKIAVIDTGIDYTHPDLKNNMWTNEAEANGKPGVDDDGNGYVDDIHGYDFANNDGDPKDGHSHGTHCAGTIAAEHNNGKGVAGVMSEATLVAVKFLTDKGSGTTEGAIKSIDYATKIGVDIMSNSWGGGGFSKALKESIDRANEAGIIFTAAAGNSASNNDSRANYPSNYDVDNIIAVAAHNAQNRLASFSCYGAKTVDVAAPGRNILSTVKNGGYKAYSGTSMATPHVSGVVGLLVANEGRLDPKEVRDRLVRTSVKGKNYSKKSVSNGRVDALNFLNDEASDDDGGDDPAPTPKKWKRMMLDSVVESAHPYANADKKEFVIEVKDAKFVRLRLKKYHLERGFDFLEIRDENGVLVEKITGMGEDYEVNHVKGSKVTIKLISDNSEARYGFRIEAVDFVE
jgi:thermitase